MVKTIFFFCLIFLPSILFAQEIDKSLLKGYNTAFVLSDRATGVEVSTDPALCAKRRPPCSTFKIYNTLIGLEVGLLNNPDAPWYKWDGIRRDIEAWNHDLNLREAFRVSAVPAFQILARQIGEKRMKEYIEKISYGSEDISSGIDTFWLPRPNTYPIMISAEEQAALLNKLLDGKLPFSENNIAILKDIMRLKKTDKGILYGKTGSSGSGLGWFVGFVESQKGAYVFACNITGRKDASGKTAREIVENVLISKGLL